MNIEIKLAKYEEKHLIKKMLELYAYDFSEFEGTDLNEFGEYGYKYLDHYWVESERYPFLIWVDDGLAGFVLVNRLGSIEGVDQAMAEFCILRKYRKRGVGKFVALSVFDQFPGRWEVKTQKENVKAAVFWDKIVREYSGEELRIFKDGVSSWDGPIWVVESEMKRELEI